MKTLKKPSPITIGLAFASIYLIWGSTYFFIQIALRNFPPMILGAFRFLIAGISLLIWCRIKGDRIRFNKGLIVPAISGLVMVFIGTGLVIQVECTLPSAMVAILLSAEPIWLVFLDRRNWRRNLNSKATIAGLMSGFAGIVLLFKDAIQQSLSRGTFHAQFVALVLLVACSIAWSGGALYFKYRVNTMPPRLSTAWQMMIGGLAFIPTSFLRQEWGTFHFSRVTTEGWLAASYLVVFGSIAAYGAYMWLLKVRSATLVGTHGYVNPVVAVLLGMLFAGETISGIQLLGLAVILISVLLVSLSEYGVTRVGNHKGKQLRQEKDKALVSQALGW